MALKTIDQSPTIIDDVLFNISTPDANGCFIADPYSVSTVTIYYAQRDFASGNIGSTSETVVSDDLANQLASATALACANPTEANLDSVQTIQNQINLTATTNDFYFSEAQIVAIFGSGDMPAWSSIAESVDNVLTHITVDANNNPIYGSFQLCWKPLGMREGDYFICYTWYPQSSGDSISARQRFALFGSPQLTTSIPTHYTVAEKYETLQERYTPEAFKMFISANDLSPEVIQELNKSIAKGFTFVEDLANQMVDLIDANYTPESMLQLLGDLFSLQLRSNDPTLWRRQIKRAIPLFKKKGTLAGLCEALAQASIGLTKYARLWQVISSYTYQEAFEVLTTGQTEFTLSKIALALDTENFELYYRANNTDTWINESSGDAALSTVGSVSTLTWTGSTLQESDWIRVVYKINEVPNDDAQTLETYLRSLPLADQRDERNQDYPLKNWNVRVVEDDDALLDSLIPTRNPWNDWLIFGKVRTEFPYSENIFNMEEYNGSRRDSYFPCDIDKDFVDPCSGGLSSKFTVNLQIDTLSDDRINEAKNIITDYTPFHAVLHSINLIGNNHEFIQSPQEEVIAMVNIYGCENMLVNVETIFNRSMAEDALFQRGTDSFNKYESLATYSQVYTNVLASASNQEIVLFSPNEKLTALDLTATNTFLEVLAPSANAGTYTVELLRNCPNYASIQSGSVAQPINQSAFTFRLSNQVISKTSAAISPANIVTISDDTVDLSSLEIITAKQTNTSLCHTVTTNTGTYYIEDVLPNGSILLIYAGTLPTSNLINVNYTINTYNNTLVVTSTTGILNVVLRGIVDLSGGTMLIRGSSVATSTITNIRNFVETGNYLLYSGTQYLINGFVTGQTLQVYINGYNSGTVSGVPISVYERVADNATGYFKYNGLTLTTTTNFESTLSIMNGSNPPSEVLDTNEFMESFLLVLSNSPFTTPFGPDYYAITGINGTNITIAGPHYDWTTTGTNVLMDILQFTNTPDRVVPERDFPPVVGNTFDFIDRRGNDVIGTVETDASMMMRSSMRTANSLNATNKDQVIDAITQTEGINFSIKWAASPQGEQ